MRRKLLGILLSLCMVLSLFPAQAVLAAPAFSDMPAADNWAYDALNAAADNGLLQGDSGRLMPEKSLTRAELAAVLNRAFGAEDTADISGYTDVASSTWYYSDIARAVRMGTFQGSGGAMRPEDPVTRQEAFTVLARAFKLPEGSESAISAFSDRTQVSSWALPSVAAMVSAGYIQGSAGKLNPASTITRAEFAQVMYNLVSVYLSKAGTYTADISGNAVVNAAGVTLRGVTISGDLILGEGVGSGDVTLDGVTVTGRVVVRGGGENSIHIINSSSVGSIIVSKTGDGGVRIQAEEGCRVQMVYVDDGSDDIILEGVYNAVTVQTDTPVTLQNASVTTLSVTAGSASVTVGGTSTVTVTDIAQTATGATLTVTAGATVARVESTASQVVIQGGGTVTEAVVSGNNTAVNTQNTSITAAAGTTGVTNNGTAVTPGGTTGGGTTGGGGSGNTATVATEAGFLAAANNSSVTAIVVNGEFTVDSDVTLTKPVTVNSGAILAIGSATVELIGTLTNNGTIYTINAPQDGVEGRLHIMPDDFETGTGGRLINNGAFYNNGHIEIYPLAAVTNTGTFENSGWINYLDFGGFNENDASFEALYEAPQIPNVTDKGGDTQHILVAFGILALQTALARSVSGTDDAYYRIVSIGLDDTTFTTTTDLIVRSGQELSLQKTITFVIPSGHSLTIEAGGQVYLAGTLTINGTAINRGTFIKESCGVSNGSGSGSEEDGGKHYFGHLVADSDGWNEALADPTCYYAEITGSLTITADTPVPFPVFIDEGASLTVGSGKTLTLKTGTDQIIGNPYIQVGGRLTNNGTVVLERETGIRNAGGTITNTSGTIEVYGWLDADEEAMGGTVNHYANLTDVARQLWSRLGGILHDDVDEATDYVTYADALAGVDDGDTEGKYALTWLFKNSVLSTSNFDPYTFADRDAIADLLGDFATAAGTSWTPSISGTNGVCSTNGTETTGSSLDQLMDSYVAALSVGSVDAATKADLLKYLPLNYVQEIHITGYIELTDNLSILKHVVIDPGATLTAAAGKNITVEYRNVSDPERGSEGVLVINGTLAIPSGSFLNNMREVDLSGTIVNNGTFTNMRKEDTYGSSFYAEGGTIQNHGVFVSNDNMELNGTALVNDGSALDAGKVGFTNNTGSLIITGGSIDSSTSFHNAGYMKICDTYGKTGGDATTEIKESFITNLTNDSNWIEYTAQVYSADGLAAAQAAQTARIVAQGDTKATTGLEIYGRMDIMADIELPTGTTTTLSGWDVWVETVTTWNEVTQKETYDAYELTVPNDATLTMYGGTLHVNGSLVNAGTIILGTSEKDGILQVWPTGSFVTSGTVNADHGIVYRMDEYKETGSEGYKNQGSITGYSGYQDIAVVHDWAALFDAADTRSSVYERIDIMGDHCDIELGSSLTVSADVYIEWDDGIEVPIGMSLTLAGSHWLNNSGDLWVYGSMAVGTDFTINNDGYIQVDGTVNNSGTIYNYNNITLFPGGRIMGSGNVFQESSGTLANSGGAILCAYWQLVRSFEELSAAEMPALIEGEITLKSDLTLTHGLKIGMTDHWGGTLHTGAYTLTVPAASTLAVENGELEIGTGDAEHPGALVNNGTVTVGKNGGIKILAGGTLETASDINVYGYLNLYDPDTQHSYITGTGAVNTFADENALIQCIYRYLYQTSGTDGAPTGIQSGFSESVNGKISNYSAFDTNDEANDVGALAFSGWSCLTGDSNARFAYAALYSIGMISGTEGAGSDGIGAEPYSRLTYAQAKVLMAKAAQFLGADITEFLSKVSDDSNLIISNNFTGSTASDFDEMVQAFTEALDKDLRPTP
ncbi:S-layer homology domain-containing protein [Papillibacter cinnamivorans]|uniref:S-layer homology domain-containing protein n=1 Tax=Papillibacter cinnamivorans DSM 12816 TaxID=1122930 RepID=A0A1W2BBZ1_9FIRM|nr:S-layer homology domain-containing protein [Papillibacter cinnamivorans]SMC70290.1 S-layer homology domain-containing protein [Papillibacter cinnamivorans DSM 12816]